MKRVVARATGLGVVVGAIFANAIAWNSADDAGSVSEETSFADYRADFVVDRDGDVHITETLTVDVPGFDTHGIFRLFDRADPTAPDTRRTPYDISVARDGEDEPFEVLEDDHRRFTNLKIGSADETLAPGQHVYEIQYSLHDAIQPGEGVTEESQFYWQLIPIGWQQHIARSTLTVHLPVPASEVVQCAVGIGETSGCTVDGAGTDTLTVTTGALEDHTPVSIKAGLDLPTPEPDKSVPWSARFDRTLGTSPTWLGIVVLMGVGAGVVGNRAARRAYEADPQFPLTYAPPEGVGPAQARYILDETIDREAYVATLMYAAEQGAIDLDKSGEAWTITDKRGADGWAGLDVVTVGIAQLLGGRGTSFAAAPKDIEAGKRLKAEIADFESSVKEWATASGNLVSAGLGGRGGRLVMGAFVLVGVVAIWNPFSMTMLALVPGAFAVTGSPMLRAGAGTKRTRQGRDLWSRVGGFKRILSTPSAKDRFDFSGREELYTAYLPWAVAFGCADEWAAKYRTEMGVEPPTPSYFGSAYAGAYTGTAVSSMVSDFDSTVSSAISSYQATQSSSSSGGGGGFSGGGGGGGGGGGSW